MKVFHNAATKHYMRATEVFHETPCRAPGLFLVSKTDLIGAEKRSRRVYDLWVKRGMKVCASTCTDEYCRYMVKSHNCFEIYFE